MSRRFFEGYTSEIEAQLDEFFSQRDEDEVELVLRSLSVILHQMSPNNSDIIDLYNILPLQHFLKVITLYDGRTVSFPKKNEMRDALLLAIGYYYREVKGYDWDDIKKVVPFDFSSISLGLRIKSLNKYIQTQLHEILSQMDDGNDEELREES